jgi:hypothetical protein
VDRQMVHQHDLAVLEGRDKHCFTQARNIGPFIAPSSTNGAVMARCRRPPTKVIVFQCPCGA